MLVLIVEDDPMVALDLEDIVLACVPAAVMIGNSVESATPLLDEPIDFALLDVDLPDGNSFGVAASLQRRNVPFAFVSGSRRQDMPAHLQRVPFVAKPYSPGEITGAMRAAGSRQAA
jgi:DNA-binding response OmpR family regulator